MTAQMVPIIDGPSKFYLLIAKLMRLKVRFTSQLGICYTVVIHDYAPESGDGESWNIDGHVVSDTSNMATGKEFRGYFRTNKRVGHLLLGDEARIKLSAH